MHDLSFRNIDNLSTKYYKCILLTEDYMFVYIFNYNGQCYMLDEYGRLTKSQMNIYSNLDIMYGFLNTKNHDEFIDLNFVYPDLMSGIEMIFNKTDTLNDIIEAVKQEMDFDSNIMLTLHNKRINYNINDLITNCGIKNNDIIYVNYV